MIKMNGGGDMEIRYRFFMTKIRKNPQDVPVNQKGGDKDVDG